MIGWDGSPVELPGGGLEGRAASAFRALDAFGPLDGRPLDSMTEAQAVRELLFYLGDFRWCAGLGCGIARSNSDMYRRMPPEELEAEARAFAEARACWAREALRAAASPEEAARAKAYARYADSMATLPACSRTARAVQGERPVRPSELDRMPALMGTPDGVLDLERGRLLADEALWDGGDDAPGLAGNVTMSTAARMPSDAFGWSPDPDPRWEGFVMEVCDGRPELASFLRRAMGYTLLGGNPEKATFVLWGPNRNNGKSTLMAAVKRALGDYAADAPAGLLLAKQREDYNAASPVLARMPGARLCDVSEPPLGAELDGSMVKKLASGSDAITVRDLHRPCFSYVPSFCVWMHCNSLPAVRDLSAIDPRRMFVLPFTRSFEGAARDTSLAARFATPRGMSTVLAWAVRGFAEWAERGLDAPACVEEASGAWLATSDSMLSRFIREMCTVAPGERCEVSDFKAALAAYAEADGEDAPPPMRAVNRRLAEASVKAVPSNGRRFYRGLSLKCAKAEM